MGSVFSITRGGKGSVRAQKKAIDIARNRGKPLVFLFVADSSFLNKLAAPKVVDIRSILMGMGRFPLHAACERASAEGLGAESLVRHGVLHHLLPDVISETDASTIIVSHQAGEPSCFERAEIDKIVISLRE